jgi:hypothetical protein
MLSSKEEEVLIETLIIRPLCKHAISLIENDERVVLLEQPRVYFRSSTQTKEIVNALLKIDSFEGRAFFNSCGTCSETLVEIDLSILTEDGVEKPTVSMKFDHNVYGASTSQRFYMITNNTFKFFKQIDLDKIIGSSLIKEYRRALHYKEITL